ncbi:hypothetical protein MK139_18115, partial [bacterium]|nr:hypothetical protein [bacterium]
MDLAVQNLAKHCLFLGRERERIFDKAPKIDRRAQKLGQPLRIRSDLVECPAFPAFAIRSGYLRTGEGTSEANPEILGRAGHALAQARMPSLFGGDF